MVTTLIKHLQQTTYIIGALNAKKFIIFTDVIGLIILIQFIGSLAIIHLLLTPLICVLVFVSFISLAPTSFKSESAAKPVFRPVSRLQIINLPCPPEWKSYEDE